MHISKVELENFKSHANSTFEFSRGTTAITGENGAGKTSIIEAIAWTIFDALPSDYKKDDLIRRGTKKGIARVTFESGLDERAYVVYRDTGTGYYVYDPQLKTRIADKKEEVTRFLWQHLGIEPGTDLRSLYTQAIGVPQGTFTAIFMAAEAERKRTFDSLLKVEEYRRSSDELLKTVRFVEQQIAAVNVKIARAEGEIVHYDAVERELSLVAGRIGDCERNLAEVETVVEDKKAVLNRLDETEAKLIKLTAEAERLRGQLEKADLVLKHSEIDLARAREAAAKLEEVRPAAAEHQQVLGRLHELERERGERQKLREELAKTDAALVSVKAEQKLLQKDLEKVLAARTEAGSLQELAVRQQTLEAELDQKRNEFAKAEAAASQMRGLEEQLSALRRSYREASDKLAAAREKVAAAAELDMLASRDAAIIRELAMATAALERDERFQREIKNGLCPILSERCLNLKEGQTLESFVSSHFGELRVLIDTLVVEQVQIGNALKAAREGERFGAQISLLESRIAEIGDEGKALKAQKAELVYQADRVPQLREEFERVRAELNGLDNPRARMAVLEKEALREFSVRESLAETERNIERLESERQITIEGLEVYKDLDTLLAEASAVRERTAESYRVFTINEDAAAKAPELEAAYDTARTERTIAADSFEKAEREAQEASEGYDRELHIRQRRELTELEKRHTEAAFVLETARTRQRDLAAEMERLSIIRQSMQEEFREREKLQKIAETTDFIRSTLKEAAPLVARNYVHHVSLEANQMFREIGGDAERTLKWGEDYAIVLEEGGYDRPFQSLSGGEQMAAALAVRLTLLKQLSDIHIAFFDEPTTNMDAERRENLAAQIGNIRHFDQMFVISHDDTFEGHMDHEIKVGE